MKKYYIQPIVETTDIRGGFTMQVSSPENGINIGDPISGTTAD